MLDKLYLQFESVFTKNVVQQEKKSVAPSADIVPGSRRDFN